jgi:hypothetical protein
MILEVTGAPASILEQWFYEVATEDMGEPLNKIDEAYHIDHYTDMIEVNIEVIDRNYYWENVLITIGSILEDDYNCGVTEIG